MSEQVKFVLGEQDIPTHWVNLMADIAGPDNPPYAAVASSERFNQPDPTIWRPCSRWR